MASADIKKALQNAFPTSSSSDWKRRSKKNVSEGVERVFENTATGQMVTTVETTTGVTVSEPSMPLARPSTLAAPSKQEPQSPRGDEEELPKKNLGRIMVAGSVWEMVEDVTVTRLVWRSGNNVSVAVASIKAGAKLTVERTQMVTGGYGYKNDGYVIPVVCPEAELVKECWEVIRSYADGSIFDPNARSRPPRVIDLPISQLAGRIRAIHIPYTPVFVLRDAATKKLFGSWEKNAYGFSTDRPKMVDKLSSAKKYKTQSAVKASIREFSGYNSGLDDEDGAECFLMGGSKVMELPPTWEMVEFCKVTGDEKRVIEIQEWYSGLWKLRGLTVKYGPAAREAYIKAKEPKNNCEALLIFQFTDGETKALVGDNYYSDPAPAMKSIKDAVKHISGKVIVTRSKTAFVYACVDVNDAMTAYLAFNCADQEYLKVVATVVDINTLDEVAK